MCFFENFKKRVSVWPRRSHNQNLKEIRAFGSEIIATRTTDGRTTDDGQKSHTMNSADSQAELKLRVHYSTSTITGLMFKVTAKYATFYCPCMFAQFN